MSWQIALPLTEAKSECKVPSLLILIASIPTESVTRRSKRKRSCISWGVGGCIFSLLLVLSFSSSQFSPRSLFFLHPSPTFFGDGGGSWWSTRSPPPQPSHHSCTRLLPQPTTNHQPATICKQWVRSVWRFSGGNLLLYPYVLWEGDSWLCRVCLNNQTKRRKPTIALKLFIVGWHF